MLKNHFIFAGESSLDYGIGISGSGTYNRPAKRADRLTVPGRNGDLFIEDGSFENREYTYPAYIVEDLPKRIDALSAFLLSANGYQRLEDTYHPECFRQAIYLGGLDVTPGTLNAYGKFEVKFDVKPQKFLKSGEIEMEFTQSGSIFNQTRFSSKPLIRVYGTGVLGIGSESITILEADEYTDIDCDAEEAYKDSYVNNCNNKIVLSGTNFPKIRPGESGILLDGITKVIITPRWFTI